MVKDITDNDPNPETVRMLKRLLEKAERGELRTIVMCNGWSGDWWCTNWVIDKRNSRRRMIGQMAITQFDLLTKQALDDGNSVLSEAL